MKNVLKSIENLRKKVFSGDALKLTKEILDKQMSIRQRANKHNQSCSNSDIDEKVVEDKKVNNKNDYINIKQLVLTVD